MGALLDAAIHPRQLHRAWQKVARNRGCSGGDGLTVTTVAARPFRYVRRLAADLREGSYRPGALRRVEIPKRSGGTRRLAIPCVLDRVAQTAVAMVLQPRLEREFEDASYGYRPGRSVNMAVERVSALQRQGFGWVVDADIDAFFDHVPHGPMRAALDAVIDDDALLDLVDLWLESFDEAGVGVGEDVGLAQGSPLSPLLANLYLDALDERMAALDVQIVRFADDFLLLCRSRDRAERALAHAHAHLRTLGLSLDPEKTRVVPFEEGFRFLGKLFTRAVVAENARDEAEGAFARGFREEREPGSLAPDEGAELDDPATAEVVGIPEFGGEARPDPVASIEPAPPGRYAPYIRPLYVFERKRRVDLRNESFVVEEEGRELIAIQPGRVDRIDVGPGVDVSVAALRQAAARDVPVHFLDGRGRSEGVFSPRLHRRADLHLAQAAHVLDENKRVTLARLLVDGRLQTQQGLLNRLNKKRKNEAVRAAIVAIKATRAKLGLAHSVSALTGHEGDGTADYWPALGRCLAHGWRLTTRERRPAPDPVNSVIDWLSSMLTRDVHVLVERHGLHPGFGILHGTDRGHDGCVYDLVEEFRAPLAEGLAVYLFNNRILQPEDFVELPEGVRVAASGRRDVVRAYEAWLDREVESPREGRKTTWRGVMDEQVAAYVRHLLGERTYRPYKLDY